MSKLGKLIIDCPKYGHDEYLINTEVAIHVQEADVTRILKYFSDEAIIDFKKVC